MKCHAAGSARSVSVERTTKGSFRLELSAVEAVLLSRRPEEFAEKYKGEARERRKVLRKNIKEMKRVLNEEAAAEDSDGPASGARLLRSAGAVGARITRASGSKGLMLAMDTEISYASPPQATEPAAPPKARIQDNTFHRLSPAARPIPLPPFLRPQPRLRNRRSPRDIPYDGTARLDRSHTIASSARTAPFSTAFAANPYAHALATPVRQCSFTGHRLPMSCMLDFHLAPSATSHGKVELAPLSLRAALVPRQRREDAKLSEEEAEIVGDEEDARWEPLGVASYVTNQRRALAFVASEEGRRDARRQLVRTFVVGRRAGLALGREGGDGGVEWRDDMEEFVLRGLRDLVVKRLRYFLASKKGVRDGRGLVAEVPGGKRRRLDEVEGVVAVLRLRAEEPKEVEAVEETLPITRSKRSPDDAPKQTHIHHSGPWTSSLPSYLNNIQPLPPPSTPPTLYVPTLRYRNQRVALYNLFELLGEDRVGELVKGTVFEDDVQRYVDGYEAQKKCEWVTVQAHRGTVELLGWCAKLAWYAAGRKGA